MSENFFSIIIPHLNEWYLLDITLDSIYLREKYTNFEIIIVDDWTPDYWDLEFLKNHFLSDKIRLYKKNMLWLAAAKNFWASVANGNILFFLDSHMYFFQWILERLNEIFNKIPDISLAQPQIGNFKIKNCPWKIYKINDYLLNTFWDEYKQERLNGYCYNPNIAWWATVVKKSVFDDLWWFNPNTRKWWAEDIDFSMRAWLYWYKSYSIDDLQIAHYFKQKFENTVVEGWDILYNKIMFAITCFQNSDRLKLILKSFEEKYESNFIETYNKVINNVEFLNWSKFQQSKFKYNDDWYFDFFKEYYPDFQI